MDGDGIECENLRTVVKWDDSVLLPHVPDSAAPDKWKLEQNEMLADGITFNGGEKLTLKRQKLAQVSQRWCADFLYAQEM